MAEPTTGEVGRDVAALRAHCLAVLLRDTHQSVAPGYHLNKRHWNTVTADGSVPAVELRAWIDDSYDLVVAGLPRA